MERLLDRHKGGGVNGTDPRGSTEPAEWSVRERVCGESVLSEEARGLHTGGVGARAENS